MPIISPVPDADGLADAYAYPDGRTWIRANFVSTVDGAARGTDGRSASISPEVDRSVFALLRSLADVILVGAGTARQEGYEPVRPDEVDAELRESLGLAPVPPIALVTASLDLPEALVSGTADAPRTIVNYLNVDVNLVRLITVIGAVFGVGAVVIAYVIAWVLMPSR